MRGNKHLPAVIAAYLIWGSFPMFLKLLTEYEATKILFYRIFFALGCITAFLLLFHRKKIRIYLATFNELAPSFRWRAFLNITGGGILLSLNWLLYIYTVNSINIQTASFAYMICPVLTALLGFMVLKEKLLIHHRIAIVISIISCVLLGTVALNHTLLSLAIALSYALYVISQKKIARFHRIITLWIQLAIAMFAISITFGSYSVNLKPDNYLLLMALIMAIVFTITPLLLSLYGLDGLSSGTIGFLMYLNPLMNFFIAFLVFHEKAGTNQIIAYVLTLGSVLIYNMGHFKKTAIS